jgi:hypothetical protein
VVVVLVVDVLGMAVAMVGWAGRCCRADSSAYTSIEREHGDWAMGIAADQLASGGDAGAGSPSERGADDVDPRDKPGVGTGMLGCAGRHHKSQYGGAAPGRQGHTLTMPLTLFSRMCVWRRPSPVTAVALGV